MPEQEDRQNKHLRRTRPTRVVNELARDRFKASVVTFYADELAEVGFDTNRVDKKALEKLSPAEKSQLCLDLYRSYRLLATSGLVNPEALYLSSRCQPRQRRSEDGLHYFARLDQPFFDLTLRQNLDPYLPHDQPFSSVLALGCGVDLEAATIRRRLPLKNNRLIHVGVDLDAEKLKSARQLNPVEENYHYIEGEFNSESTRQALSQLVGSTFQFDLVIARHFPVWKHGDLWDRTLTNYAPRLKKGGLLLLTLYYDQEFDEIISNGLLLPPAYQMIVCERNKGRAFNQRVNMLTIFQGFMSTMGASTILRDDPYQNWLNNNCRDKFVILGRKV